MSIETEPHIQVGEPLSLSDGASCLGGVDDDVVADGQRFVMIKQDVGGFGDGSEIRVVVLAARGTLLRVYRRS